MSLRVWLPLTKDLRNQGLSNVTVTNNGATFNSAGKLGGCYYFNRSTPNYLKIDNPITTVTNGISMAFWVKIPSNASGNNQVVHIGNGSGWNNNRCTCFIYQSSSSLVFSCSDGGGSGSANSTQYGCKSSTLTLNEWTHIACTYSTGIMKIYLNGVLDKEYTTSIVPSFTSTSYIGVGAAPNANEPATVYVNDVRIYDHALSPLEVKHIAQGLILHYPLNRQGWGQENLLKYTKVNSINQNLLKTNIASSWDRLTLTTKDGYDCYLYPMAQSSTWFHSGDWYSGMKANTTYTYTAWIYFTVNTNFNFGSLGHFQVFNSASTASDKAHEDVVSARIYEPSTIVANTWTKVRITFTTNNLSNSIFRIYPRYALGINVGDLYFRDCKLEESTIPTSWCPHSGDNEYVIMGLNDNVEYDTSGYENNGKYYAYDTNGSISYTSDTPKYNVSTHIASANPTQNAASGTRYLYGHCELTNPTQMSVAFWLKPITGGYGSTTSNGQGYFCTTNYEYGDTSVGVDYQASAMNHRDGTVNMNDSASTTQCNVTFYPTIGEWHHYVYTYDGQVGRGYKDGVQTATAQFSAAKTLDSFIGVVIGFSKAGRVWRRNDACYSDFRIYATALSADDVKSLYQNSAYIDNQGNIYGAVYEEV